MQGISIDNQQQGYKLPIFPRHPPSVHHLFFHRFTYIHSSIFFIENLFHTGRDCIHTIPYLHVDNFFSVYQGGGGGGGSKERVDDGSGGDEDSYSR